MRFVDTNILLYAASNDPAETHKSEIARQILQQRDIALSVQVLQEFYVQATRQSRASPMPSDDAARLVHAFMRFPIADATPDLVEAAITTSRRFQVSYWDAAIIEAARELGCETLLSEDLGDGQDYAGVRVLNPFKIA